MIKLIIDCENFLAKNKIINRLIIVVHINNLNIIIVNYSFILNM